MQFALDPCTTFQNQWFRNISESEANQDRNDYQIINKSDNRYHIRQQVKRTKSVGYSCSKKQPGCPWRPRILYKYSIQLKFSSYQTKYSPYNTEQTGTSKYKVESERNTTKRLTAAERPDPPSVTATPLSHRPSYPSLIKE